jgi:hypothetical protein
MIAIETRHDGSNSPAMSRMEVSEVLCLGSVYFSSVGSDFATAHINRFNVNLDHILNDHSGQPAQPVGKYAAKVLP